MVVVAQLAERLVVVQEVAGSTPVDHPEQKGRYGSSRSGPFSITFRPHRVHAPALTKYF